MPCGVEPREGFAAIANLKVLPIADCRLLIDFSDLALTHNRHGPAREGAGDEAMPIDRDAGIGNEQRAGNHLARVGGDERDVGIA